MENELVQKLPIDPDERVMLDLLAYDVEEDAIDKLERWHNAVDDLVELRVPGALDLLDRINKYTEKICDHRLSNNDPRMKIKVCTKKVSKRDLHKRMTDAIEMGKSDPERAHGDADSILIDALESLGFKKLIELYNKVYKY